MYLKPPTSIKDNVIAFTYYGQDHEIITYSKIWSSFLDLTAEFTVDGTRGDENELVHIF